MVDDNQNSQMGVALFPMMPWHLPITKKIVLESQCKINKEYVCCKVQILIPCNYGFHGTRNFSFLAFFQFLVSRREIGDEKREIDFLHFLPNIGLF